jgi:LacI family transcriptional regulator
MAKRRMPTPPVGEPFQGLSVLPGSEPSLAQQLADQLRWRIASQQLRPGDVLPPARHLAAWLHIHLHTVRAAYHLLAADGLVEVRRGIRTRVLPHSAASLAQPAASATHTIAVILPSITNPFYHHLVDGIEAEASLDGVQLFLGLTHDDPRRAERHARQAIANRVDGILAVAHDLTPVLGLPTPIPVVTLDCPDVAGPSVTLDLEAAGLHATRHLIEHGHRRIAYVTAGVPNLLALRLGYLKALAAGGIRPDDALVILTPDFLPASGGRALQQLLALSPKPSAVFVGADVLAIGLFQAAAELDCRIPEKLAVASFNDIPSAAYLNPPLTTVAAPARQMGEEAMHRMRVLWRGERSEPEQVRLACELVIRRSCGCIDSQVRD